MNRKQTLLTILFSTFGISALAGTPAETFSKTCNHYQNRTVVEFQRQNDQLAAVLAEACTKALDRYQQDPERGIDAEYLERLTAFKATVINMNVERLTQRGAYKSGPSQQKTLTRTGEYLIAVDMGVIRATDAWAEAAQVTLARQ